MIGHGSAQFTVRCCEDAPPELGRGYAAARVHPRRSVMKLHEAMAGVLAGQKRLSASEIASEINRRGLYSRGDGQPVPANQISARANKYPHLFARDGGKIRLHRSSANRPLPRGRKSGPVLASSVSPNLKFWDLGTIGELIKYGLPSDNRLITAASINLRYQQNTCPDLFHQTRRGKKGMSSLRGIWHRWNPNGFRKQTLCTLGLLVTAPRDLCESVWMNF